MATLQIENQLIKVSPKFKNESNIILENFNREQVIPINHNNIDADTTRNLNEIINSKNSYSILSNYRLQDIVKLLNHSVFYDMENIQDLLMTDLYSRLTDSETIKSYKDNNIDVIAILDTLDEGSKNILYRKLLLHYNMVKGFSGELLASSEDLEVLLVKDPPNIMFYLPRESRNVHITSKGKFAINNKYQIINCKNKNDVDVVYNYAIKRKLELSGECILSRDGSKVYTKIKPERSVYDNYDEIININTNHMKKINQKDIDYLSPNFNYSVDNELRIHYINTNEVLILDDISTYYKRILGLDGMSWGYEIEYSADESLLAIIDERKPTADSITHGKIMVLIVDLENRKIIHDIVIQGFMSEIQHIKLCNKGLFYTRLGQTYDEDGNINDLSNIYYLKYDNPTYSELISTDTDTKWSISEMHPGLNENIIVEYSSDYGQANEIIVYRYLENQNNLHELMEYVLS